MIMRTSGGDRRLSQFLQPDPDAGSLLDCEPPMENWRFLPNRIEEQLLRGDFGHFNMIRKPRIAGSGATQPAISASLETLYFG